MEQASNDDGPGLILIHSLGQFLLMFFVSGILGIAIALASALVSPYHTGQEVGGAWGGATASGRNG